MSGPPSKMLVHLKWDNMLEGEPRVTVLRAEGVPSGLSTRVRLWYGDKYYFDGDEVTPKDVEARMSVSGAVEWGQAVQFDFECDEWLRVELWSGELLLGSETVQLPKEKDEGSTALSIALTADAEAVDALVVASPSSSTAPITAAGLMGGEELERRRTEKVEKELQAMREEEDEELRAAAEADKAPAAEADADAAADTAAAAEEDALKRKEEEDAQRRAQEDAQRLEEEAALRRKEESAQDEELLRKEAEAEAEEARKREEDAVLKRQAEEEAALKKQAEEEAALKKQAEEEAAATREEAPKVQTAPEQEAEEEGRNSATAQDEEVNAEEAASGAEEGSPRQPDSNDAAEEGSPRQPDGDAAAADPGADAPPETPEQVVLVQWEVLRCSIGSADRSPAAQLCVVVAGERSAASPLTAQGECLCKFSGERALHPDVAAAAAVGAPAFTVEIRKVGVTDELIGMGEITAGVPFWDCPVWLPLEAATPAGQLEPPGVEMRWRVVPADTLRHERMVLAEARAAPLSGAELEVRVLSVDGLPPRPAGAPVPANVSAVLWMEGDDDDDEQASALLPPIPPCHDGSGTVTWDIPLRLPVARVGNRVRLDVLRDGDFHGRAELDTFLPQADQFVERRERLYLLPRQNSPVHRDADLSRWAAAGGVMGSVLLTWRLVDAAAELQKREEEDRLLEEELPEMPDGQPTVRISVDRAARLAPLDIGGRFSSARVEVLRGDERIAISRPVKHSLAPEWGLEVEVPLLTKLSRITFRVLNDPLLNAGGDGFLGEATYDVSAGGPREEAVQRHVELPLRPRLCTSDGGVEWNTSDLALSSQHSGLGAIHLTVSRHRRRVPGPLNGPPLVLRVTVDAAAGFDGTGTTELDPVVVLAEADGYCWYTGEAVPERDPDGGLVTQWVSQSGDLRVPANVALVTYTVQAKQRRLGSCTVSALGSTSLEWHAIRDLGGATVGRLRASCFAARKPASAVADRGRLRLRVVRGDGLPDDGAAPRDLSCTVRLCPCSAMFPAGAMPDGIEAPLGSRAETAAALLTTGPAASDDAEWRASADFDVPAELVEAGATAVLWVTDNGSCPPACLGCAVVSIPAAAVQTTGQTWAPLQPRSGVFRAEDERRERFSGGLGKVLVSWETHVTAPADISIAVGSCTATSTAVLPDRVSAKLAVEALGSPPGWWFWTKPVAEDDGLTLGAGADSDSYGLTTLPRPGAEAGTAEMVTTAGRHSMLYLSLWNDVTGASVGYGACAVGSGAAGVATVTVFDTMRPSGKGSRVGSVPVRWKWLSDLPPAPDDADGLTVSLPPTGGGDVLGGPLPGPAVGCTGELPAGYKVRVLRDGACVGKLIAGSPDPLLAGTCAWSRGGDMVQVAAPPAGYPTNPTALRFVCVGDAASHVGVAVLNIVGATAALPDYPAAGYATVSLLRDDRRPIAGARFCTRFSRPEVLEGTELVRWTWAERFAFALPPEATSGGRARSLRLCVAVWADSDEGASCVGSAELSCGGEHGILGGGRVDIGDGGAVQLVWSVPQPPPLAEDPRAAVRRSLELEKEHADSGPPHVGIAHILQTHPDHEPHCVTGGAAVFLPKHEKVIVVGGINEQGLYEPLVQECHIGSRRWDMVDGAGPPVLRDGHTAVAYDGTRLVVYGGWGPGGLDRGMTGLQGQYTAGNSTVTITGAEDESAGTFQDTPRSPTPRPHVASGTLRATRAHNYRHSLQYTARGRLAAAAGPRGYHRSVLEYDTSTRIWRELETCGVSQSYRAGHSSVVFGQKMVVWGGWQVLFEEKASADTQHRAYRPVEARCNDMSVLDLETLRWKRVRQQGEVPRQRSGHTAVRASVRMWVFGGCAEREATDPLPQSGEPESPMTSGSEEDDIIPKPTSDQILRTVRTRLREASRRGRAPSAAPTHDVCLNDLHCFDPATRKWSEVTVRGAVRPPPRHRHVASAVSSGGHTTLLVHGGVGSDGQPLRCCYQFVVASGFWREVTYRCRPLQPRVGHCCAVIPNSRHEHIRKLRERQQDSADTAYGVAVGPPGRSLRTPALPAHDAPLFQILLHGGTYGEHHAARCYRPVEGPVCGTVTLNIGSKEPPKAPRDPRRSAGKGREGVSTAVRPKARKRRDVADMVNHLTQDRRSMRAQEEAQKNEIRRAQEKKRDKMTAQQQTDITDRLYYKALRHSKYRAEINEQREADSRQSRKLEPEAQVVNVERMYYQAAARAHAQQQQRAVAEEEAKKSTRKLTPDQMQAATERLHYRDSEAIRDRTRVLDSKWGHEVRPPVVRTRQQWSDTVDRLSQPPPHASVGLYTPAFSSPAR